MRRLLLLALALACGGTGGGQPTVSSVDVQVSSGGAAQIGAIGGTLQLSGVPKDAGGKSLSGVALSWTSSNPSIAAVDQGGLVTAAGNGSATISAAAGAAQGSLTVTVAQIPASVVVLPATQTVGPGVAFSFTAQRLDSNGHAISAGAAVAWTIDDSTVASLDAAAGTGVALKESNSTTHVHATAGGLSGSATLIVDLAAAPVASVSLSPASLSFSSLTEHQSLDAKVLDRAGTALPVAASFSSSDPAVATVSAAGVVTSAGNGTANITATAGGKSNSTAVTVQQVVTRVLLTPPALTTLNSLGQTLQLSAAPLDALDNLAAAAPLTWSTSGAAATVDNKGLVAAVSNGTAVIRAASGALHADVTITVQQTVQQVNVAPGPQSIAPGKTLDFTAAGLDGTGHLVPGAPAAIWQSSDARVTIDATGHAIIGAGFGFGNPIDVTISATIAGVTASETLTVDPALTAVAQVVITGGGASLASIGDTAQLSAQAEDAAGNPVPRHVISWSVGDGTSNVITIDQAGLVTAAGNGQKSIIAGTNGVTASIVITVAQVPAAVRVSTAAPGGSTVIASLQGTLALQATAFDARNHAIPGGAFSWNSDSANATVDQGGLVTGIANGPANIFAAQGAVTSTPFAVTVAQAVDTIQVSAGAASTTLHSLGDTVQLTASAFDARSNPMTASFVWSPTAGAAATVDQAGLVTAVVNGTANVQASSGGKIGSLAVTVQQVPVSVSVSGSSTLVSFQATAQLTANGVDARGHAIPGLIASSWRSDSSNVSVSGTGVITANANGTANLFATAGGIESPGFLVTVAQDVASVSVTGNAQLSSLDQTSQLTATAIDANGFALQPQPNSSTAWALAAGGGGGGGGGGGSAVTLSSTGLVTAQSNGSATANATIRGKTGSLLVTVLQLPVGNIPVTPPTATLAAGIGATVKFTITGSDANGNSVRSGNTAWVSSNPAIAVINANGTASAIAPGTVTISGTLNGIPGTNTAQLTVTPQ